MNLSRHDIRRVQLGGLGVAVHRDCASRSHRHAAAAAAAAWASVQGSGRPSRFGENAELVSLQGQTPTHKSMSISGSENNISDGEDSEGSSIVIELDLQRDGHIHGTADSGIDLSFQVLSGFFENDCFFNQSILLALRKDAEFLFSRSEPISSMSIERA